VYLLNRVTDRKTDWIQPLRQQSNEYSISMCSHLCSSW